MTNTQSASNYIEINGSRIHYESYGSGEPIIFIAGLGSFCESWQNQTDYFSKKYHVILVDLPGLGLSGPPAGQPTVDSYANDIAAFIEKLGLKKSHFVGVSIGGAIGFSLAAHHPERIGKLVVINMDTMLKRRMYNMYQFGLHLLGKKRFANILGKIYFTGENTPAKDLWVRNYIRNNTHSLAQAMRTLKGWGISSQLPKIQCPVLIIASDEDATPVEVKKSHLSAVRHLSFTVIPGAKHFVHCDKPSQVNHAIDEFLIAG